MLDFFWGKKTEKWKLVQTQFWSLCEKALLRTPDDCHAHLQLGDGGGLSATHGKWYRNTPTKYGCNYHQIGRQVHIHTKHVGIGLTHDLFATCFGNIHLPTWIPLDIGIFYIWQDLPPFHRRLSYPFTSKSMAWRQQTNTATSGVFWPPGLFNWFENDMES